MKPEFKTRQIDAQPILGIRATTTMDKLPEIMGVVVRRDIRVHSAAWSGAGRHAPDDLPLDGQ